MNEDEIKDAHAQLNALSGQFDKAAENALKRHGLYACATCGEPVRHYGQRCERCAASIEEDRLNRGD